MGKLQDRFEDIRALKDQGQSITKISKELGIKNSNVRWIFSAINAGQNSLAEYQESCVLTKTNPETGQPFTDFTEYRNYRARTKGFKNMSHYVECRRVIREDKSRLTRQDQFERGIKILHLEDLAHLPLEKGHHARNLEQKDELQEILERIPNKWRTILEMRYIQGLTQEETASLLDISYQGVQQKEWRALKTLASGGKIKIKERKPIEDGELLLTHVLSRSTEDDGTKTYTHSNIRDYINEFYHEGDKIRSIGTIRIMTNKEAYKRKIKGLKEKYFPQRE